MVKTPFFRVAVEGTTVDNREITRAMIQQMADSYNPATYTARINCEHLRGYSPEGPFNAWGSVDAVKAEEIELELGGKSQKRLALFASFDVTDAAKSHNKAGQKLFSSVEIQPDFAKTGKAYLVGLAFTDSPASLGTEVLKFSRDDDRKNHLLQNGEIEVKYVEEAASADAVTGAFGAMKTFFENLAKPKVETPPAPAEQPKGEGAQADQFAAFTKGFAEQMEKLGEGFSKAIAGFDARVAKLAEDHKALTERLENTPASKHNARPVASGGNGEHLTDF